MTVTAVAPTPIDQVSATDPAADPHASLLLRPAAEVARILAETGVEREKADKPPREEIDLLRRTGLLRATAPSSAGGAAVNWPQLLRLVREVGSADASIGQLFAYHHINLLSAVLCLSDDDGAELIEESARNGWFWGDAVNPLDPPIVLTPNKKGTGWKANGRKSFTTGSAVADRLFVSAELDGIGVALQLPADREGVSFDRGAWDLLGQRLTESGPTIFTDVAIEEADFLTPLPPVEAPLTAFESLLIPLIHSAFAALYVGAARGALLDAAEYVRTTTRPWLHSGLDRAADDPLIVERFGQLDSRLRAAEALIDRAGEQVQAALERGVDLTDRERGEVATTVSAAKVFAIEIALDTTSSVFEVQGARSTARSHGFDRRWRDVRTHSLHDPVFYKAIEVGNLILNDQVPEPDGNRYR